MTLDDLFARIADVKIRCQPADAARLTSAEIQDIDNLIAVECADRFDDAKAEEDTALSATNLDANRDAEEHDDGYGFGH